MASSDWLRVTTKKELQWRDLRLIKTNKIYLKTHPVAFAFIPFVIESKRNIDIDSNKCILIKQKRVIKGDIH